MTTSQSGNESGNGKGATREAPPIDFTTFILSLGQTALVQLGRAPGPDGHKQDPDPIGARETIDILAMLREKTRGNLSGEEQRFLEALLHDLRMQCVEATKR